MTWIKEIAAKGNTKIPSYKIAQCSFKYFDMLKKIRNGTFVPKEPEQAIKRPAVTPAAIALISSNNTTNGNYAFNNDPYGDASAPDNYDDLPPREFSDMSNDSERSTRSYTVSPVNDTMPIIHADYNNNGNAPDELELPDFMDNNNNNSNNNNNTADVISLPCYNYPEPYQEEAQKYAGIKNQGATCYLNSYIQTLFHIPYFRSGIYEMQIDSGIPLALQKLFFLLQTQTEAASTKELTNSFGWSGRETDTQHDIQEFSRVLTDSLSERIKKTTSNPHDNIIRKLFRGELVNYVRCTDIDYQSRRTEEIYDLSLVVKGMGSLKGAFNEYVKEDTLDGDNKYEVEFPDGRKEKHPAKRGCIFKKLPPVLMCHLKRFDFDMEKLKQVKVNERFTFETEIDLTNYVEAKSGATPQTTPQKNGPTTPQTACLSPVDPDLPRTGTDGSHCSLGSRQGTFFVEPEERHIYCLHSVMVHSGSIFGGHYVGYIRPNQGPWMKFDDSRVTQVTEQEAVENNFGRVYTDSFGQEREDCSNAYYLTYIRKQLAAAVYSPPSEELMESVRGRLEKEIEAQAEEERERRDARTHYKFRIVTIDDILEGYKHGITDLFNYEQLNDNSRTFRIVAESSVHELRETILSKIDVPEGHTIKIWKIHNHRVTELLDQKMKILESIFGRIEFFIEKIKEFGIFVQIVPIEETPVEVYDEPVDRFDRFRMHNYNNTNIVFLKEYDPVADPDHPLKTVGYHVFKQETPYSHVYQVDFKAIVEEYKAVAKNPPAEGEQIICFSETEQDNVEEVQDLNLESIFTTSIRCSRGLILIFQKDLPPTFPSAQDYYMDKLHSVNIDVYPRPFDVIEDPVDEKNKFTIKVRTTDKVSAVVAIVADHVNSTPEHTRLYGHHPTFNRPTERAIDRYELSRPLQRHTKTTKKLYYDVIDLTVEAAEKREEIPFRVVTTHGKVLSRIKHFASIPPGFGIEPASLIVDVHKLHCKVKGDETDEVTEAQPHELCIIGDSKRRAIEDVFKIDSPSIRFHAHLYDVTWRLCRVPDKVRNVDGSIVEDEEQEIIEVLRLVVDSNSLGKYGNTAYEYYGDGFLIYILQSDTTESLRGRIKQALRLDEESPSDWDIYLTNEGRRYVKLEPNEHVQAAKEDIAAPHVKVSLAVRLPQSSEDEATMKRIKETTSISRRDTALKFSC
eukprot:TRINITY_DN3492_c0_g3_i2.p1 TRINITY_DN3492_c0_g3~~TRINITY_DN3492_c0_g3_i2.p1  ORF type:complete len:1286 (+),score=262.54 TRINITY_DN3492_c0_g3_i2:306-3860(+)